MSSKFMKTGMTGVLLLIFAWTMVVPMHGQGLGQIYSRRQGRREGRIVLPTPPFNPDAGILSAPAGQRRTLPQAAPRRSIKRRVNKRNPRPGTPRRRRVRRGWHRR